MPTDKHIAVYLRVSSKNQDTKSQEPALKEWAAGQKAPVRWYRDKFTGKTIDRPGWQKLESELRAGKVMSIVVWRLDRLGRIAKGLTALFEDLQHRHVGLISLREGLDLSNPAGRLMAHVLASVAQYETEVRAERVRAGQAAARAAGKSWGGSKPGRRVKVTPEQQAVIRHMKIAGEKVAVIARTVSLSRPTIYSVLES
jgi:DNA invertase Pin-like site-specific DNA recombinase